MSFALVILILMTFYWLGIAVGYQWATKKKTFQVEKEQTLDPDKGITLNTVDSYITINLPDGKTIRVFGDGRAYPLGLR